MAFISNTHNSKSIVGKVRTLKKDCSAMKGTIVKGSKVTVTGVSSRGYDIKDIESGEGLVECGFDCIDYFEQE